MELPKVILPIDPNELYRLYAKIGCAVWSIQVLEDTLSYYLIMINKTPGKISAEDANKQLGINRRGTLGKLLVEYKKEKKVDLELEKRIDAFLQERNWLIHNSRRSHHAALYHVLKNEKLKELFERLDALADEATALNKCFVAELGEYLQSVGVSKEEVNRNANKVLHSWMND